MQRILFLFVCLIVSFSLPSKEKNMSFHDLNSIDIKGNKVSLSVFKGKPILVVNVASKCGYTPQYEGLENLYKKYKDKGLVILGFPSNDFGAQEPGTEKEIISFCKLNYGVSFDLMKKVKILGQDKDSVYKYLTESGPESGEVKWNFEKFLVDKQGKVRFRFNSAVIPESDELKKAIESVL